MDTGFRKIKTTFNSKLKQKKKKSQHQKISRLGRAARKAGIPLENAHATFDKMYDKMVTQRIEDADAREAKMLAGIERAKQDKKDAKRERKERKREKKEAKKARKREKKKRKKEKRKRRKEKKRKRQETSSDESGSESESGSGSSSSSEAPSVSGSDSD